MQKQHGFTLIELLISLAIFSIALLGLVQMQILSLKNTNDALQEVIQLVQEDS